MKDFLFLLLTIIELNTADGFWTTDSFGSSEALF